MTGWKDTRWANVLPGWEPLVDALHVRVIAIEPRLQVQQIKEKFGGMRYYYSIPSDIDEEKKHKIENLVAMAESRSLTTCEVCGEMAMDGPTPGERGWLNALCPEHMAIRDASGDPVWKIADEAQIR